MNDDRIGKIKRHGRLKTELKLREEQKPFLLHNRYLEQKVKLLQDIHNAKMPIEDKMN